MSLRRIVPGILLLLCLITIIYWFLLHPPALSKRSHFRISISRENLHELMTGIASQPHRAGTKGNHAVAELILRELRSAGLKVSTVEYEFQLPEPAQSELWLTEPEPAQIDIREKAFPQDSFSTMAEKEIPFFAYAPDADIQAPFIYANFGNREDYDWLKKNGVEVKGKIAIVRSSGCRGMAQIVAQEEGIAGLLLYPEIKDQGFRKTAYPDGPHLNFWTAQRGSMLRFFDTPGDPFSSEKNLSMIPKVPALPITPFAASRLMSNLQGLLPPKEWQGGMSDVSYRIGPGPSIRMISKASKQNRKIVNIFGRLEGTSGETGPEIFVGCHYDAWVYGAADPSSATAAVLETANAFGMLRKQGWIPRRPVTFVFWDAEEYGMLGSTKWIHDNPEAARNIYSFLYVDGVRAHYFSGNVLPGLQGLLDDVLEQSIDPDTGKHVIEIRRQHDLPNFTSDTIAFTNSGVPVAQFNYGGSYSMYHSIYDDLHWFRTYLDPGDRYTASMAEILSQFTFHLADSVLLPFRFSELCNFISAHARQIQLDSQNPAQFDPLISEAESLKEFSAGLEKSFQTVSGKDMRIHELNSILLKSLYLFRPYPGAQNFLVAPASHNGCGGESLPGLRTASPHAEIEKMRDILRELRKNLEEAKQLRN